MCLKPEDNKKTEEILGRKSLKKINKLKAACIYCNNPPSGVVKFQLPICKQHDILEGNGGGKLRYAILSIC